MLSSKKRFSVEKVIWEKKLVEAAGVEPASENVTGKENYMLSQFMLPAFTGNVRCRALRTDKKRWQLARWSRLSPPGLEQKTSPLNDVFPRPAGVATEDGYLIN